jgi:hypothetical protein
MMDMFSIGGIECIYFFAIAIASCIVLQFSDVEANDEPLKVLQMTMMKTTAASAVG